MNKERILWFAIGAGLVALLHESAQGAATNDFYHVGDKPAQAKSDKDLDLSGTTLKTKEKRGPLQILTPEQRTALSRITSKGFIIGQKTLKNGRKELTWTNGKDTVVTTQKVERIQAKKSPDPRRAEIAAVKAERDTAKADRDSIKAERDNLKTENDKLKKEKKK
jgi:FtsZ-binding cell division protein ZapB